MLTKRTVIKHIIKLTMVVSQITVSTRLKHREIPAVVGKRYLHLCWEGVPKGTELFPYGLLKL